MIPAILQNLTDTMPKVIDTVSVLFYTSYDDTVSEQKLWKQEKDYAKRIKRTYRSQKERDY